MTDSLDEEFVKLLKSLHSSSDFDKPSSSFVLPEEPSVIWKPVPLQSPLKNINAGAPETQVQSFATLKPTLPEKNVGEAAMLSVTSPPKTILSNITGLSEFSSQSPLTKSVIQNTALQSQVEDTFSFVDKTSSVSDYFKELSSKPVTLENSLSLENAVTIENKKGDFSKSVETTSKETTSVAIEKVKNLEKEKLIEFKISKKNYNWIYLAAFVCLILLMFLYIYWFYVKDYKNFLNKKNSNKDKLEDVNNVRHPSINNSSNLLQNNSMNHEDTEDVYLKEDKKIQDGDDTLYEEAETFLKTFPIEKEKEKTETVEEEYFEPLQILNSLQNEKTKKIVPSRIFFDLSDVDEKEMIPVFQEKEKHKISTKLSDESPEVNEYAKKREKLLESL